VIFKFYWSCSFAVSQLRTVVAHKDAELFRMTQLLTTVCACEDTCIILIEHVAKKAHTHTHKQLCSLMQYLSATLIFLSRQAKRNLRVIEHGCKYSQASDHCPLLISSLLALSTHPRRDLALCVLCCASSVCLPCFAGSIPTHCCWKSNRSVAGYPSFIRQTHTGIVASKTVSCISRLTNAKSPSVRLCSGKRPLPDIRTRASALRL
jgi:hypothetical protein